MSGEIQVPAMGESITEATIGEILVKSGSYVKMDEELIELETDKVNQVLFAPAAGVVQWSVSTGDVVKIGQQIGKIEAGEAPPEAEVKPEPQIEEIPKEEKKEEKIEEKVVPPREKVHKAAIPTKHVRRSKEDFLASLESKAKIKPTSAPPSKPEPAKVPGVSGARGETRKKLSRIREVIGKRLVEVQNQTAMLTTFNEVDLSRVMELRAQNKEGFQEQYGVKLGFMSFFVKAAVFALQQFPEINSYLDGDELVHREYFDIGIAVSTDRGLVVPVVRDCDALTFAEVERAIVQYAEKARTGTLALDDLQGGGFTITNGGVFGSLLSTPILNPPQCAILGMHKIQKRAVVIEDEIVIRPMMYLALSYDHRIVDGKEAVTFLVHIKEILEDPARLLLGV